MDVQVCRVLVLCPAGRDATENTQCTSLSASCDGCSALKATQEVTP